MSLEANVENCKERVAYQAKATNQGERMRIWVNVVPLLGAPVAACLAWLHPLLGSVAVAALTLGWLIGVYRTELTCQTAVGRLQDAEQDLLQARTRLAGVRGPKAERGDFTSVPWASVGVRKRPGKNVHTPVYRH